MPASHPVLVVWSDHALAKAELLDIARTDVERIVLSSHHERTRNTGAANWLIVARRLAIAYNHPDGEDESTARIVTLWRQA